MRASPADRAALEAVLARPEFRGRPGDEAALRRLLAELWDRLLEALGTAEAERYASLGRLVFLSAVALAALLLWRAARRRATGSRAAPASATAAAAPRRAAGVPRPEAAERALAAGDLAGAVRRAYACAAGALEGRAQGGGEGALTGAELSALADHPGFAALARLHDRTVFGRRPPAEAEARQAVAVARRIFTRGEGP